MASIFLDHSCGQIQVSLCFVILCANMEGLAYLKGNRSVNGVLGLNMAVDSTRLQYRPLCLGVGPCLGLVDQANPSILQCLRHSLKESYI